MPSVSESRYLEDVPAICPHAAKMINADVTQDQNSANGEQNSVKVQDESYSESGENSESQLENREQTAGQRNWIRPDLPSRCTWSLGADISESPHSHQAW